MARLALRTLGNNLTPSCLPLICNNIRFKPKEKLRNSS